MLSFCIVPPSISCIGTGRGKAPLEEAVLWARNDRGRRGADAVTRQSRRPARAGISPTDGANGGFRLSRRVACFWTRVSPPSARSTILPCTLAPFQPHPRRRQHLPPRLRTLWRGARPGPEPARDGRPGVRDGPSTHSSASHFVPHSS